MHPSLQAILDAPSASQTPPFHSLLPPLSLHLPLLNDLASTPQDPLWHAEGDVATHTAWVMQEAAKLADSFELSPPDRLTLLLSALLHDIAKPLTTCERSIDNLPRIVAPHHAHVGRNWLACRLLHLNLPYPSLLHILSLVGSHHDPKKLILKNTPPRAFPALALSTPLPLLYLLTRADMQGRLCEDKQHQLDIVELFRMECESQNLLSPSLSPSHPHWTLPWAKSISLLLKSPPHDHLEYTLANGLRDFLSGTIFSPEEAVARSFERRKQGLGSVTLTCGPSGSGKSLWISQNLPNHDVISLDDLRLELTGDPEDQSANGQVLQLARDRLRISLRARRPVVWDSTSLRLSFRSQVLQLAREYGLHTTLVTFHLTPEDYAARNRQRSRQVPPNILDRQIKSFEWPLPLEADRSLFINAQGSPLYDSRTTLLSSLNT